MGYLIHIAYVLSFCSFLVRDILWLRLLTIIASLCVLPYYFFRAEPLIAPIGWNFVFIALNVAQIYLLILERRPVKLSAEEQHIYQLVFRTLTPREFLRLVRLANWRDADAKEALVHEGDELRNVLLIAKGRATVESGGKYFAVLEPGQFVGEMSFLTGEKTSANVVALERVRLLSWPKDSLKNFLSRAPELRAAIQVVIGADLVQKLRAVDPKSRRSAVPV